jgi:N-acetylglucosamine repressor
MPKICDQWYRDILRVLYQRRTVTRRGIIEATRLNVASVSHTLQHLLQCGTILKVGELQTSRGRKREVLTLNAEAWYFAVADLEGSRLRFALTNLIGDIRFLWEEDWEFGNKLNVERVINGIKTVIQNGRPEQYSQILAIGISHPGIMDKNGCITAVNLGWSDLSLAAEIEERFNIPVFLEEAHRSCVVAEHWLGAAKDVADCAYVIVGNGIGVGIFLGGHLVQGHDGIAGELGHLTVDLNADDKCNCGKRGCLEAIASSPNIVRQYLEKTGGDGEHPYGHRVLEVYEKARQGDAAAIVVLDRAARYLGLALSHLTNLFNPQLIVLGGDIIYGEDVLLPRIRDEVLRHALPKAAENVDIRVSNLGADILLKAAASLAFQNALESPTLLRKICSPISFELPAVKISGPRSVAAQKVPRSSRLRTPASAS